jgi:putative endonuclease
VTRRFVAKGGEVDIVALDGETLVFVEVKYRREGEPEAAVGDTKIARFTAAAEDYLAKTGSHKRHCRFDLVAVTDSEIRHYPGAFRAP